MPNLLKDNQTHCPSCGVPNLSEVNQSLWDIYSRISDGRSRWEPLVYTSEEFEESWDEDYQENYALIAMERDMYRRGLCPTCGRPDLRGVREDDIIAEEDYQEMCDMWAMEEAERRAGG